MPSSHRSNVQVGKSGNAGWEERNRHQRATRAADTACRVLLRSKSARRDLQYYPGPSTGLLALAVAMDEILRRPVAQEDLHLVERHTCEGWELLMHSLKAEVFGIESDGAGDVLHLITDAVEHP
jgi:hypothetical protein